MGMPVCTWARLAVWPDRSCAHCVGGGRKGLGPGRQVKPRRANRVAVLSFGAQDPPASRSLPAGDCVTFRRRDPGMGV